MMVQPPSSVSSITSGSKSSTPVGSGDLSGCLRSLFTTSPPMQKYPLLQYRSRDASRIVVIKLFGMHFSSSRHEEPRSLQARFFLHVSATARGHKSGMSGDLSG